MKILYCGISSKFIHTMPAGWHLAEYLLSKEIYIDEIYHNVNEKYNDILSDILSYNADWLLFSVYIFNVNIIKKLIADIRIINPQCIVVIGGPEADNTLAADYTIYGEGEQALYELIKNRSVKLVKPLKILDDIPTPYTKERIDKSKNKLIYYESSRGCPFSCSYCMAGKEKGVRYFSLERVKSDLANIVANGAKIIKFTDRTFNANTQRTNAIITYINQSFKDKNVCFHFEVGGDLFAESTLKLLSTLPQGLVQMEAGVQTLNEETLRLVNRVFNKDKFIQNIKRILSFNNIHLHLDLIAGLPKETLETFKISFNEVFALRPHMLQLGFLKFLKGTPIRENYQASFCAEAPYEIISSPDMTNENLQELKRIETVLDKLYNKGKFHFTFENILKMSLTPYEMFKAIADYFALKNIGKRTQELDIYKALLTFMNNEEKVKEYLRFDYLLTNNSRKIPHFLRTPHSSAFKRYQAQIKPSKYVLYEEFTFLPINNAETNFLVRFNYEKINPVNKQYDYIIIQSYNNL